MIARDWISIAKNGIELGTKAVVNDMRNETELLHSEGDWTIKTKNTSFMYKEGITYDSTKIGIGYSGAGKESIPLYYISIEDKINQK
jgi:hypothetical protein